MIFELYGEIMYGIQTLSLPHLPQVIRTVDTRSSTFYCRTVYRDHEGLGFLAPKHHLRTSLIFTL